MAANFAPQEFWRVPYCGKLEGPLQPGQSIVIRGLITGPETFSINLSTGPTMERDDIVFHLSVRQKEKALVMNTFKDGKWGDKEERKKNPFKENEPFDIRIRCHDNKFEIFANQKEVGEFEYRQPLMKGSHLIIDGGGVELHGISWGGKYYPVPYTVQVDGGIGLGKKLFISGVPDKSAKRFHVNLLTQSGETAFHFNPRFDEKVVVRNAQLGGAWQAEEREGKLPFQKDIGFDLVIANEPTSFLVYVNGVQFCSFAHRADPKSIAGLEVAGDLELTGVNSK